jgi:transketolase
MTREFDSVALARTARELRCTILRMITNAGSGHPGGSLSAIDILTYLYFHHMRIDSANPAWEERDRFVMSKGHCSPAVYVCLARLGYFPEDMLWTLRDVGSKLQGHPDMNKTPGIDMTTGSLGQGFSCAVGIALGARFQKKSWRVFSMLGDGEIQEGVIWEAAMAGSHYKLDNLVAVIDNNRIQTDGFTADIMSIEPIEAKWEAFGWHAQRINGHDFNQIHAAYQGAMDGCGRPHVIVADTVKGKGIAVMENNPEWHGLPPKPDQLEPFLAELMREERA